ncbi:TBC1 domain family member 1 [Caerostris extrusa]|uniref:TBC1 domain family member 1 n=1 Tax=Caerostris extrusa TaxID=172846 RepID=A0AAV4WY83_CAEEX|nr:TBC1 domain family member 1 [Caerostris extrusa]
MKAVLLTSEVLKKGSLQPRHLCTAEENHPLDVRYYYHHLHCLHDPNPIISFYTQRKTGFCKPPLCANQQKASFVQILAFADPDRSLPTLDGRHYNLGGFSMRAPYCLMQWLWVPAFYFLSLFALICYSYVFLQLVENFNLPSCHQESKIHDFFFQTKFTPGRNNYKTVLMRHDVLEPRQYPSGRSSRRTFPNHPFYSQALGAGQLSLFNLLKAYSLLDQEVGYCQGLSFVAGILLLHMPEEQAFLLMKYLMFNLGIRRQYKTDMVAFQIQMYQLSRLIHDNYKDLYDHLEKYDIAPTLYAAPWFLTLFASQFPVGFVARLLVKTF